MSSKAFVYPSIELVPGDKVRVDFYAEKAGKLIISFESYDSVTNESDLGFVVMK